MITWQNLLDGYSPYSAYLVDHSPVTDIWGSRFLQEYFLDGVLNAENAIYLIGVMFIGVLMFMLIAAMVFNIFAPLIRRLGQW